MHVTNLDDDDRTWVRERTELLFGGDVVVSRDIVHAPADLPGFICTEGSERVGLATYKIDGEDCELVTLDALCQWCGVGTALLEAVEHAALAAGCTRIWLITTNDNLDALRFFQRRDYVISDVRCDSVAAIRQLKPDLPLHGHLGIPIRDEIELEKRIAAPGQGWRIVE